MIGGFPLKNFRFIGITESFEESIKRFGALFNLPPGRIESSNINPAKGVGGYVIDAQSRRQIENITKKDMKLYREALRLACVEGKRGELGGIVTRCLDLIFKKSRQGPSNGHF